MMSKRTSQYGDVPSPRRLPGHNASLSLDSSAIKGGIRGRTRSVSPPMIHNHRANVSAPSAAKR